MKRAIIILALVLVSCKVTALPDKDVIELCASIALPALLAIAALVVRL